MKSLTFALLGILSLNACSSTPTSVDRKVAQSGGSTGDHLSSEKQKACESEEIFIRKSDQNFLKKNFAIIAAIKKQKEFDFNYIKNLSRQNLSGIGFLHNIPSKGKNPPRKFVLSKKQGHAFITVFAPLGYNSDFNQTIGTMSTGSNTYPLSAFNDNNYSSWSFFRDEELVIDEIPVDDFLRRKYWDTIRSPECVITKTFTFNPND